MSIITSLQLLYLLLSYFCNFEGILYIFVIVQVTLCCLVLFKGFMEVGTGGGGYGLGRGFGAVSAGRYLGSSSYVVICLCLILILLQLQPILPNLHIF
jgi:hypothetical protein